MMIGPRNDEVSAEAKGGGGSGGDGGGILKKGPWTALEDEKLMEYVRRNGEGNWNAVQRNSGLLRCGKSCRLRWANHLRPSLKKGSFSSEEESTIIELHSKMGNKWARMATQLPGRTDNEIKNYWNTRIKRRQRQGLPLYPPDIQQKQRNDYQQNHTRQSPMTLSTENTTQFGSNPTPFSWFEPLPINFSSIQSIPVVAPPIYDSLPDQHCESQPLFPLRQQLKRARLEDLEFQTMLDATSVSSMVPMHRYSSRSNYLSLQIHHQQQQQQQQKQQNCSPFSTPMELPSSQYLPAPASECDNPWDRNNSGLLESLFQNTQTGPNRNIAVRVLPTETNLPKSTFRDQSNRKDTVEDLRYADVKPMIPIHGCTYSGIKPKIEPQENPVPDNEDLMALLDSMVTIDMSNEGTSTAPKCIKKDSDEISSGPSSAGTDDDLGLDMQQLSSSTPVGVAAAEPNYHHHYDLWGGHWDNMPGIC